MSTRKPEPPDDDALLDEAYGGARPLTPTAREPSVRRKADAEALQRRREAASEFAPPETVADGGLAALPVAADAWIEFRRDGIPRGQWDRFRKGGMPWQLTVDLHGDTRNDALRAVERLISLAREDQVAVVRIVHGKGHAAPGSLTIKAELNQWLRGREEVLAFCSAQPRDGGTGALYVWLRKATG